MWRVNYGNNNDSHPLSKRHSNPNTMSSSPAQKQTPASYGYLLRDFLASVNQHSSNKSEKNKGGDSINYIEEMSMGSTRWTPTPEQLYALEKINQSGTRTPSATQIQQIAARLRRFGKIEGKNVFYWFQNHKARERQKRRRQQLQNSLSPDEHLQIKQQSLGLRKCFEVGQTKNYWLTPSDCSTISEESVVGSSATAEVAKGKIEEKVRFDDKGLQLELSIGTGTATNHAVDHKAKKHKKIWMPPYRDMIKATDEERKCRKLELFPNWIGDHDDQYQMTDGSNVEDPSEMETVTLSRKFTPTHFFEFLPLNINK